MKSQAKPLAVAPVKKRLPLWVRVLLWSLLAEVVVTLVTLVVGALAAIPYLSAL